MFARGKSKEANSSSGKVKRFRIILKMSAKSDCEEQEALKNKDEGISKNENFWDSN